MYQEWDEKGNVECCKLYKKNRIIKNNFNEADMLLDEYIKKLEEEDSIKEDDSDDEGTMSSA